MKVRDILNGKYDQNLDLFDDDYQPAELDIYGVRCTHDEVKSFMLGACCVELINVSIKEYTQNSFDYCRLWLTSDRAVQAIEEVYDVQKEKDGKERRYCWVHDIFSPIGLDRFIFENANTGLFNSRSDAIYEKYMKEIIGDLDPLIEFLENSDKIEFSREYFDKGRSILRDN